MKLEICANSYQSAIHAEKAGAHRIELCSELSLGGITPSYGVLEKIATTITIPVNVLIRPRSGDFCYSDAEFDIMKRNIKICKALGFHGIVSGVLNEDNTINVSKTKELIELSKPLSFTFHRAFDCVSNPKKALSELIPLGIDRLLTSGLKDKAVAGISLLIELQKIAGDKLIILPGSGITAKNITLFKTASFKEVHASASKTISFSNAASFDTTPQTVSDLDTIRELIDLL